MTSLSFHLVDTSTYETVLAWLHKPHVNAFYHGDGLRNTITNVKAQVEGETSAFQNWIASDDGRPFGFLMTSTIRPDKETDSRFNKHMFPDSRAITLDLLIGEEDYLSKGLAAPMIQAFLLDKFPEVDQVFIDPEDSNLRAIHVYEKAGFKQLETFIAEWHSVPHRLMKLDMETLKNA